MEPETIPVYSRETLEFTAEHFLAESERRFVSGDEVLIEEMLEEMGFIIWPVPKLAKYAAGFLPVKGPRIYVDEQMQTHEPWHYRFALAEELSHNLIHRPFFQNWSVERTRGFMDRLPQVVYDRMEHDARYLAACILMPRTVFRDRVERFAEVLLQVEGDRYREEEILDSMLSRFFNVAPRAAQRRREEILALGSGTSVGANLPGKTLGEPIIH